MWDGKFMYGTDRMVTFDTPLMADMSMNNKMSLCRCLFIGIFVEFGFDYVCTGILSLSIQ